LALHVTGTGSRGGITTPISISCGASLSIMPLLLVLLCSLPTSTEHRKQINQTRWVHFRFVPRRQEPLGKLAVEEATSQARNPDVVLGGFLNGLLVAGRSG
jgi:hypothetical protein